MRDTDPTNPDPEQQDPESSAAADAPSDEERPTSADPSAQEGPEDAGGEGPPTDRLHEDPAYEPGDSGMKDIKGG